MSSETDNSISRYYNTPRYTFSDGYQYVMEDDIILPNNTDKDEVITYVEEDEVNRLDLIAFRVYGNPLLGWVIARRNCLIDLNDLWYGRELYIPSRNKIFASGGILLPLK